MIVSIMNTIHCYSNIEDTLLKNMKEFFYCFTKKIFNFSNRASRKECWLFLLILFIILPHYQSILNLGQNFFLNNGLLGPVAAYILNIIFFLIFCVPGIAVITRRLHDTNRSGWYLLSAFIPIWFIILLCLDGTKEINRYGKRPNPIYNKPKVPSLNSISR